MIAVIDEESEEAGNAGEDAETANGEFGGESASDTIRELIVKAYPDVVPELIQGATLEEMLTTLPAAQAAYQKIAGNLRPATPDLLPSGGGIRSHGLDLESLSAEQLIKKGLGKTGSR